MTLTEAVFKSLEDINELTNYIHVFENIVSKKYYNFGESKTPTATVSAILGQLIRNGDTRVKRVKMPGNTYNYYLTKNESNINIETLTEAVPNTKAHIERGTEKIKTYEERDLHKLLSTYLNSKKIYSKTIYHEQSKSGVDSNQIWTHPDMVGFQFLKLDTKVSQNFRKAVNTIDTFKISSYELKREINSDAELKKAFFQAVSNSSWANFGYLVALEFSSTLYEEMQRLNDAFGIGIIKLNSYPYQSEVLHTPKRRDLDFKTIDKLCKMNQEFQQFIEHCEKLMTAEERYVTGTEKELNDFCDKYFVTDTEIENYCKEKNIPTEEWQIFKVDLN